MHKRLLHILIFTGMLVMPGCGLLKPVENRQLVVRKEKNTIPYQIFFPESGQQKRWPVIIFLHGAGERGNDNTKQLVHVVPYLTSAEVQNRFPSIILAPQCPAEDYWAPVKRFEWTVVEGGKVTPAMSSLINVIDSLRKSPEVDTNKIYVTGLSMGGFGTFDLISRKPDWFAAAAPMCGGADLTRIETIGNVPLWIFHGAEDSVVPVQISRNVVSALRSRDIPVLYTEYAGENHGIWEKAVRESGFLAWLFSHSAGVK